MRQDEYMIVRGTVDEVQKLVCNAIGDGWMPLGRPFPTGGSVIRGGEPKHIEVAQALVCGETAARLEVHPQTDD